ncbi:hypothetical protein ACF08N_07875 [Streptomyces sp. NPDC015127]|uniref:hypothetical protein n=1 Tax=Streptomyces sp. NPDC015127 TaxID=3364939 RepID=UPI0036FD1592
MNIETGLAVAAIVISLVATRVAMMQTRIGHTTAAIAANEAALAGLRELELHLLDRKLLPYFYKGAECPPGHKDRDAVITFAGLLADVMCTGLRMHNRHAASGSYAPWRSYCLQTLNTSPVLRERVAAHGATWWPDLWRLLPPDDSLRIAPTRPG